MLVQRRRSRPQERRVRLVCQVWHQQLLGLDENANDVAPEVKPIATIEHCDIIVVIGFSFEIINSHEVALAICKVE